MNKWQVIARIAPSY